MYDIFDNMGAVWRAIGLEVVGILPKRRTRFENLFRVQRV